MKSDTLLTPSTILIVSLIHIGIIAFSWNTLAEPEDLALNNLTFVDLGSLEGNDQPLTDGAPAPLETQEQKPVAQPEKTQAQTNPQPTPKPVEQPKIKAVERQDKPADMVQEKPLTPVKQPEKQPERVEKPLTPQKTTEITPKTPSNTPAPAAPTNAEKRSKDGVTQGGQGDNPHSKQPGNPASSNKDGEGTGKHGKGEQKSDNATNEIVDGGYLNVNIPYPARARDNEEEGTVQVEYIVEANGRVSAAKVIKSSGSRTLDNAALAGVKAGTFKPKTVNGTAMRSRYKSKITFSLD